MNNLAYETSATFESDLFKDSIQVWYIDIGEYSSLYKRCNGKVLTILSDDEVAKANRFIFDTDRIQYIFSHLALRVILSKYLGVNPRAVKFHYNDHGKPLIDSGDQYEPLTFNMSHSGNTVIVAISYKRLLGVDVEHLRDISNIESLVNRFFSPFEKASFTSILEKDRNSICFHVWTRKEALIKAVGSGLAFPLNKFDVTVSPERKPDILNISYGGYTKDDWSLFDLAPKGNYVGALVSEGENLRIQHKYATTELLSNYL